tara:strand:+ start:785 stop:1147 length:363 start_codon:yes stop_codon:yes gene_type:complete
MDDNNDIIATAEEWYPFGDAIKSRLAIGLETYGHGVRVMDDTTQWGTNTDSWLEMGLEEIDDLVIYVIAELTRYMRRLPPPTEVAGSDFALVGVKMKEYIQVIENLRDVRMKIMDLMNGA